MANKSIGQSFTIKKHGVKLEVEWYNYDYFVHYTEQELNLRYDHSITGFSRCRPFHYTKEWLKLYFDENQLYQSFDETKNFILSQVVLINMIKAKFEVIKKQQKITTANFILLYTGFKCLRSILH